MDNKQKKEKQEKQDPQDWDEISENEEEVEKEKKKEQKVEKVVEKRTAPIITPSKPEEPKKVYLKTKHGDIVIDKLESYIEPVRQVRERRGDTSNNNF